jgi:molybdate transport system substrate-binding protein
MRMPRWRLHLLLLVCLAAPPRLAAQDLTVAAASDLQGVFPAIAARFQQDTGRMVRVAFGSSGNFFSQIQNGAPFDVYFSADIEYPRQLDAAGLAEPGTLYRYAVGRIVVWARKDGAVDVRAGLPALASPQVRRIAIANPDHAPYGRAAVAALRAAGLYDRVQDKLVLGENISQAAQFVDAGSADAGIIALSVALAPGLRERGIYAEIPASLHPPIEQAAVILKASRNKMVAQQLLAFIRRPDLVRLLETSGFAVPVPAAPPQLNR